MTENEAIDKLNNLHYKIVHTSFCNKVYESEIEALCMAKDCLKEIQQYRAIGDAKQLNDLLIEYSVKSTLLEEYKAIGTIEEFKVLKENQRKCEDCAGCTNWLCDCSNERARAIDDFAEKLKKLYQAYDIDLCLQDNDHLNYTDSRIALESYIDDIAKQLKAGAENEDNC